MLNFSQLGKTSDPRCFNQLDEFNEITGTVIEPRTASTTGCEWVFVLSSSASELLESLIHLDDWVTISSCALCVPLVKYFVFTISSGTACIML